MRLDEFLLDYVWEADGRIDIGYTGIEEASL